MAIDNQTNAKTNNSSNDDDKRSDAVAWVQVETVEKEEECRRLMEDTSENTNLDHAAGEEEKFPINHRALVEEEQVCAPMVETMLHGDDSRHEGHNEVEVEINDRRQKARVAAAGSACCLFGCFVSGPIGAVVAGFGTAYAARYAAGPTGDVARAIGDVALVASDRAVELDEKHHLLTR